MQPSDAELAPIMRDKAHERASEFTPESLLREARRQRGLAARSVPALCVLDPDGDMVRYLRATDQGRLDPDWACYHSELHRFEREGHDVGIVGCAVGARPMPCWWPSRCSPRAANF